MKLETAMNLALYTPYEFIYDTFLYHVYTMENTGEEYIQRHYRIFEPKTDVHLPWVKEHGVLVYVYHQPNNTRGSDVHCSKNALKHCKVYDKRRYCVCPW